jgi:head-tail adaptor
MEGLASRTNRFVRLERPVADSSFTGAGSGTWELVADIWAEIMDLLPSRTDGERVANGIDFAERPARVRIRYRADITNAMRLVEGATIVDDIVDYSGARIMQIVTVPAELGRREAMEFMVKNYAPAGNRA